MKKIYLFLSALVLTRCNAYVEPSLSLETSKEVIMQFNQIEDILDQEFYVFFYLDSCQSCRNTKMFFRKKCEDMILNVYYVDFHVCECYGNGIQCNVGITNPNEILIRYVPTVLYFYMGVVFDEIIGYQNILAYGNFH